MFHHIFCVMFNLSVAIATSPGALLLNCSLALQQMKNDVWFQKSIWPQYATCPIAFQMQGHDEFWFPITCTVFAKYSLSMYSIFVQTTNLMLSVVWRMDDMHQKHPPRFLPNLICLKNVCKDYTLFESVVAVEWVSIQADSI